MKVREIKDMIAGKDDDEDIIMVYFEQEELEMSDDDWAAAALCADFSHCEAILRQEIEEHKS